MKKKTAIWMVAMALVLVFMAIASLAPSSVIASERHEKKLKQKILKSPCENLIESLISEASAKSFSGALFTNDVEEVSVGLVEKILDKKTIEHSFEDSERKICAIVRNINGGFVVQTSITMEFLFDSAMKLQYIDVKKAYTGP